MFTQPFVNSGIPGLRGLGFGIAGTLREDNGKPDEHPARKLQDRGGQNTFFSYSTGTTGTYADGVRSRWTPQAYYFVGPFGALAEYVRTEQEVTRQLTTTNKRSGRVDNSAYQVLLSYFLTGEKATYNSFAPRVDIPPWGTRLGSLGTGRPATASCRSTAPPSPAEPSPSPIPPRPRAGPARWAMVSTGG